MSNATENKQHRAAKRDPIPLLEWIISGLGLVLVSASLGLLIHKAMFLECKPPDMQAQLIKSRVARAGYIATVELRNIGGQTAADLLIVARLASSQGSSEREATVDFLPPQSVRHIEFCFQEPPDIENLEVQFRSFHIP